METVNYPRHAVNLQLHARVPQTQTIPMASMASGASEKTQGAAPAASPAAEPGYKMPPPEKPADERQRSYIVLSFWLIVVLLGLPIWWTTTTIYRANLPVDGMLEWAEGKVSRLTLCTSVPLI